MLAMDLPDQLRRFVSEARVGRLATVDEEGRPHVVPFCFVLEDDFVYSVLDEKPKRVGYQRLRRVRNILTNPHVQVVVDRYDEDWGRLAFVQLRGQARLLEAGPAQANALGLLRAKYLQYETMDLEERPIIAIEVRGYVAWGPGLPHD
jgi:PPOX class probable F420-dependent enzyme